MKVQSIENSPIIASQTISSDEFLTTTELMQLLKLKHRPTIYKLIKEGMPAIVVGKNFRFIKHEVISYLKEKSRLRLENQMGQRKKHD